MSAKPQIPLTDVRGIGPSAAVRMRQYGIQSANQLAGMSIAEFKQRCPTLEKRGEAFVKGARRLLKRIGGAAVAGDPVPTGQPVDPARNAAAGRPFNETRAALPAEERKTHKTEKSPPQATTADATTPVDEKPIPEKKEKKEKKQKKQKLKQKSKPDAQEKKEKKQKKEKKGDKKEKTEKQQSDKQKKSPKKDKLDKKDKSSEKKKKNEKKRDKRD
jgi:hypothetical protein